MKNRWYEFQNKAEATEAEVLIYDEIGGFGVSAAQFIAELGAIEADRPLRVRIHSPGGSCLDGQAIFTALSQRGNVTVHIDGLAASMASVVAMAGDTVQMAGNGLLMVHRVSVGISGDSEDLRRMADLTDKIENQIVRIYAGSTGQSEDRIREMMDAETWLTAKEAKALGFVDEITGDLALASQFDLSAFRNAPKNEQHMVTCPACKHVFDYCSVPEVNMGAVACPSCGARLNQEGVRVDTAGVGMATEATNEMNEVECPNCGKKMKMVEATDRLAAAQAQAQENFRLLTETRAEIANLTTARDAARAEVDTVRSELAAERASLPARIAEQAAEIAGRVGVPPITEESRNAPRNGSVLEEFMAITDPGERNRFYRKNKAAIHAAYAAKRH